MDAPAAVPIVVFTGDACATCERVTAWLEARGLPFVARNVMTDIDAYDTLLALGVRRVPLTLVGERRVPGFDPDALAAALDLATAVPDRADPGTP